MLKFRLHPFDMAWFEVVLCGLPIILEAVIGLVTAFDIEEDILVSLAQIVGLADRWAIWIVVIALFPLRR